MSESVERGNNAVSISGVIEALREQTKIHDRLLELSEHKRQVLIDNDVAELTKIVNQESRLMKQIDLCEQQRIRAAEQFYRDKGYKMTAAVHMTVSELAKLIFNVEERKQLLDFQQRILHQLAQLRERNELNRQLIEQSLSFIEYTLDVVAGPDDDTVYHHPVQATQGTARKGLFDTRA